MTAVDDAFPGSEVPRLVREDLDRTLADTTTVLGDGSVFVVTGDIPAMWLRDSATQFWPYLPFAAERPDGAVADLIAGVLRRQFALIAHDPYANAFNREPNSRAHDPGDADRDPLVWERKYEVDSLCFPVQLAHRLYRLTGRHDILAGSFREAAAAIVETLERERDHETSTYRFVRPGGNRLDTLQRDGRGTPVGRTGMTWSGFRPSDDACEYGYNIPANLFAAQALRQLAELLGEGVAADRAAALGAELWAATLRWGVVEADEHGGPVLAYEVDGLGGALTMDDANLPSLLSLPLTSDLADDDPLYLRTRAHILSPANPHYWSGTAAAGIGSPHTWPRHVWPIAMAVDALTSPNLARKRELCELLARTTEGTGRMHESFDVDEPARFTRGWFSWADSMFCLVAMEVAGVSERHGCLSIRAK
ncbi:glycosyl hydrolase [Leifsonia xyli subsp. xyli]|uniref:Metal-independent alpha-mannosidase n=3 Tax=Leifsonia xyli TaxID=1575 RepID=Q6AC97_LEIXX|nr:conserved hypothetical protein [Leifsonia xyli subsp. xyli str. CTCB07]ODA90081.1 glycosyl hydrolase [Leifsonia xyli subsp. xyli]